MIAKASLGVPVPALYPQTMAAGRLVTLLATGAKHRCLGNCHAAAAQGADE